MQLLHFTKYCLWLITDYKKYDRWSKHSKWKFCQDLRALYSHQASNITLRYDKSLNHKNANAVKFVLDFGVPYDVVILDKYKNYV